MNIDQQTQAADMFRRCVHKRWENYVVHGVWWTLKAKGIELEFVTQQTVYTAKNKHVYLDCYYPAINIALEIDEPQHIFSKAADKTRELNVLKELGILQLQAEPEFIRFDRTDNTKDLDIQIEAAVNKIITKWEKLGKPKWSAIDPVEYVKKNNGVIKYSDNLVFKYKADFLNAIGLKTRNQNKEFDIKGAQCATTKLPDGREIWVPTMNGNNIYSNKYDMSTHEFTTSIPSGSKYTRPWHNAIKNATAGTGKQMHTYIFFKVTNALNQTGYKYFGEYVLKTYDKANNLFVWRRVNTDDFKL